MTVDQHARHERHGRAKLTLKQVDEMRRRRADGWKLEALAAEYGVNNSTVSKICHRKRWR